MTKQDLKLFNYYIDIIKDKNIEDVNITHTSILTYHNNVTYELDFKNKVINIYYNDEKPDLEYKNFVYLVKL